MTARSPIAAMIDAAGLRCTLCNTPSSVGCACWARCGRCGWSYEAGKECRNPTCVVETAIAAFADDIAYRVLASVPVSKRLQLSLRAAIRREAAETLRVVYEAKERAKGPCQP